MATYQARVEAVSGAVSSTTELTVWLTDGVIDVIRRMGKLGYKDMFRFASQASLATSVGLNMGTGMEILDVRRGTYSAHEIPAFLRYKAIKTGNVNYVTAKNPAFYKLDNRLYVLPNPKSLTAYISYIAPTSVTYSASAISNFPNELDYLVVLYAVLMNLQAKISDLSLPADIAHPIIPTCGSLTDISESLPTYTAVSLPVLPNPPSGTDIDFSGISEPAMYNMPSLTLTSAETLATLTIPPAPNLIFGMDSATAPTAPSDPVFARVSLTLPTAPTYVQPSNALFSTGYSTVTTHIDTNHDVELGMSKINQLQSSIAQFQSDMNNALNLFNQENTVFLNELKRQTDHAQINNATDAAEVRAKVDVYAAKVQAYVAEVNNYGTDNNAKIAVYNAELNGILQEWIAEEIQGKQAKWIAQRESEIRKYSEDVTNALNLYNSDFALYREKVQKAIADYQQETGYDMANYSAQVNAALNEAQGNVNVSTSAFKSGMDKYLADIQRINEKNQRVLTKYAKELDSYQAESAGQATVLGARLQRMQADMMRYVRQYEDLKKQYEEGFIPFMQLMRQAGG